MIANNRSIFIVHVFIQFLAQNDMLDAYLGRLLKHAEIDNYPEALASRCEGLHDTPSSLVGRISWSETLVMDMTTVEDWGELNDKWHTIMRTHYGYMSDSITQHVTMVRHRQGTALT